VFDDFLQVHIGQKPGKGADAFTIRVATPGGLAAGAATHNIVAQAPLLVIKTYDYDDLLAWLEKTVASCQADTWNESVEKLKRYFHWEFEYSEEPKGRSQ
jgi:hypothetical protein